MRIGIIGSGRIGATAAHLLTAAGHEVAIANARGPASLAELVGELGHTARAASVEEAAAFGEVVLVAIPLRAYTDLPPGAFAGKVVVDANNYYPGRDGKVAALDDGSTTSSELLAAHLPDAAVVKAFNTMYFETLAGEGMPGAPRHQRLALFVAGDDPDAKQRVGALIEELGFAAVDAGSLADSARQQPGAPLYNRPLLAGEAERVLAALQEG
ncbi:MAG: 8-hydroxy-5-deazaflavin:NADPH oxidoreductase [Solirubrobacteraceae bacterium]|jgi:predicted dinucleotide-binding enzyme|nr:8-hydroxy-5-deazaflavin:NADPH oxidoreductase [Solirubrobacteraceae bacterium]